MREFNLPEIVKLAQSADAVFKNTVFVAWSDMFERFPVKFVPVKLQDHARLWCDFQFDRESCNGDCVPRDMIFGFLALPFSPRWSKQGQAEDAFKRFTEKQWTTPMQLPSLTEMPRLKAQTFLTDGMWIVLVRHPRPLGSRNVVPFNRRKDVLQLRVAEANGSQTAGAKMFEIKRKIETDAPHPTEAQLFVTRSKVLVQGVSPNIVCARCGSQGHHMAHIHDEVLEPANPNVHVEFPKWMNVQPLPVELLNVPTTDDDKGFKLEMRNTSAQVPLRLARQMKLRGMFLEGIEVDKCGVMQLDES